MTGGGDDAGARRVSPREARRLVEEAGYAYVDVRTELELRAGHPAGAYHVPFEVQGPDGRLVPNPAFVAVMAARFPRDARLVLGCRAGGRSLRAVRRLAAAGFTDLVDQRAGFEGTRDPFGGRDEAGWAAEGLPVAQEPLPGRGYDALSEGVPVPGASRDGDASSGR